MRTTQKIRLAERGARDGARQPYSFYPQDRAAQDQDDPPSRVARLGYMEGSVSFQPAGETDWVEQFPTVR